MKKIKKILKIEGMTCSGCEFTIEKALKEFNGIIKVKASYGSGTVSITYDEEIISIETIKKELQIINYRVVNDEKNSDSQDNLKINQLIGIVIITLAGYFIINNTIGFNVIPEVNDSAGYGLLFIIGLLTSLHCIAMCGGINLSQCVSVKNTDGTTLEKIKPSILYNLGRVISYTLIGGIVGALGSVISFSGTAKGIVAIIAGLFMLIMGLNMLNIFPWLRKLNPRMPKFIAVKLSKNKSGKGPLYVGLLNGFMPCGPLQSMQLYALGTGSFMSGAMSMFLFSLGTVPLMFGFGALSTLISSKFTHKMMKASGILVMVLGVVMLSRGLSLSGISFTYAKAYAGNISTIKDGIQLVTSEMESNSYEPIIIQKGVPLRWTINVDVDDLNGCNNPVTIPKYNIQKKLVPGENVIEFVPEEEGNIVYTCWMGMISSNIRVVSDVKNISKEAVEQSNLKNSTPYNEIFVGEIAVAQIKNDIQYVEIDVNEIGFTPNFVVMQKGIKTKWVINGEQLTYCNNRLVFPAYKAQLQLKEGENEIEFIPEKDFDFNCWMGMINGYVKVVDDINKIDMDKLKDEAKEIQSTTAGSGGCCGG